ncbi:PREDICTED: AP-3 complex subunit beta-2-like [Priapulus caudatus]|uniref:AP-3 complex subunit beta-2-like n=1 Tax=Priapulus caudatus TaxID=37621 RepID=A0ABM1E1P5_PRICU|nr:PREDICTED: AP-3 complex subunit beta-2-like [Priapulus caudatus]
MSNNGAQQSYANDRASSTGDADVGIDPASGSFFSADYKRHEDLKTMLDSNKDGLKLEAMKRIIGMIAKGKDASDLFPAVVKNVVSKNIEVKKLVYVYLVRYAEEQQDLALLSISTFQRGLKDPNQLIRASALRVLSSIRVPVITPIMMLAIKESVTDMSPFVRKTAAHAIPKLHSLDPEQKEFCVEIIEKLLSDKTTRDQFQLGTLSHFNNAKASGYQELPDWPATAADPSVRNVEVPMPWSDPTVKSKKTTKKKQSFYSDSEHSSEDSSSGSDSDSDTSEESGSEEEEEEEDAEAEEAGSSKSGKDGEEAEEEEEESSESDESSSEAEDSSSEEEESEEEPVVVVKPKKRPPKHAKAPKKEAVDLLLDLDDVPSVAVSPFLKPGETLTPSLLSSGSTSEKTSTMQLTVTAPAHVPTRTHELLNRMAGAGLSVSYRFTRGENIYSASMVTVELTLTNHSDNDIKKISLSQKKSSPGMELKSFPEIECLAVGELRSATIGIDYADTTQPAVLEVVVAATGSHAVSLPAPVGEQLQPIIITDNDFRLQQAKLKGMNENTGSAALPPAAAAAAAAASGREAGGGGSEAWLRQRVYDVANLAPVPAPDLSTLHFAARTRASHAFVLVSVRVADGNAAASVVVHCEKMVVGSMLLKEITKSLCAAWEIQSVVLSNIATMTTTRKSMFEPYLKSFFVRPMDPTHIKLLKLEILTNLQRDQFQLGTLSHFNNAKASGYQELPDWPATAADPSVRNVEVPMPWSDPTVKSKKTTKKKQSFYSDSEHSSEDSSSGSDSDSDTSEESGSEEEEEEEDAEAEEAGSSKSGKDGEEAEEEEEESSESDESSSEAEDSSSEEEESEEEPVVVVKPKKRPPKHAKAPKKEAVDLLLDLDDVPSVAVSPFLKPGETLTPSLLSSGSTSEKTSTMQLTVTAPAHVPTRTHELLNRMAGAGLSVSYRFTRGENIYSASMVTVELTLTNHSDNDIKKISLSQKKSSPGMELKSFPEIECLAVGESRSATIGIDYADTTQPAVLEVVVAATGSHAVSLPAPVGEQLQPIIITDNDFRLQQAKLKGMNENTGSAALPPAAAAAAAAASGREAGGGGSEAWLRQRVYDVANLAPVPAPDLSTLHFAARTRASHAFVLVSVRVADGNAAASVVVHCEKMVVGSMLLKEITKSLCAA